VQQLGFEGMPRRLYACTPTRLGTWLDCPRRYRLSYLDRPPPGKGPPWAHNSLGASVHNALAGWWRLTRAERTVPAAGALLERGWIEEGFADAPQSARYRRWARVIVEAYVRGLDPASEPVGVERTVAARTDRIAVSGRIDRLDERHGPAGSGELVVVDYKTGRRVPAVGDTRTSLALALYALAAGRVMRRPCLRVELHHLPTGQVLAWEHTAESLARQLRRAEDIAAECAAADAVFGGEPTPARDERINQVFPVRPGSWCSWCDYRAHCPVGSAASERRQPWDGLVPPDGLMPEEGPTLPQELALADRPVAAGGLAPATAGRRAGWLARAAADTRPPAAQADAADALAAEPRAADSGRDCWRG